MTFQKPVLTEQECIQFWPETSFSMPHFIVKKLDMYQPRKMQELKSWSLWSLDSALFCFSDVYFAFPAKNLKAKLMFSLCSVGWDHQSGANRAAGPKSWLGWTHIITWSWTMCFAKDNFAWLLCGRQDKILRPLKVIYCLSMISNAKQPQKMISPKWPVVVNLASPKFRLAGTKPNVQVDTGF